MKIVHRLILFLATLSIGAAVFYIVVRTGDYYWLPIVDRPHHPGHSDWKPGGIAGHGLGITGTLMIVIMLVYSLRKRIRGMRRWGKLSSWLNYHIFLGIAGPVLITFHTSFKFGGLISVAYWSMIAVAVSGFIGRYIYVKIPRRISGEELTLQEADHEFIRVQKQLQDNYNLSSADMVALDQLAGTAKIRKRGLSSIFYYLILDLTRFFTVNRAIRPFSKKARFTRQEAKEFRKLLKKIIQMNRRISFLDNAQRFFHYWHVIHRPFAYTMIVIVIIHVYIVMLYGYRWIF